MRAWTESFLPDGRSRGKLDGNGFHRKVRKERKEKQKVFLGKKEKCF
jgi:hypothetical protein